MNTMRTHRYASSLCALLLCAGCASTPESTPERDEWAKHFEPVTRDSVIYVYRPDMQSPMASTELYVNRRLVGSSLPGTYFRIPVLPGNSVIDVFAGDGSPITVATRGNDVVFVELRNYGTDEGTPNMRFRQVSAEAGKQAILDCCSRLELYKSDQPRLLW